MLKIKFGVGAASSFGSSQNDAALDPQHWLRPFHCPVQYTVFPNRKLVVQHILSRKGGGKVQTVLPILATVFLYPVLIYDALSLCQEAQMRAQVKALCTIYLICAISMIKVLRQERWTITPGAHISGCIFRPDLDPDLSPHRRTLRTRS
jgi:hypothetical protein